MSEYYNPKRTKGLYEPNSPEPFKLSRTKIDLFIECQRCFYLDRRLGVGRPPGFPFALNSAVDHLLKKEFDTHREAKSPHPLMEEYGLDAIPFQDERMEEWRDALRRGVQYHHAKTNLIVRGGVDDIWVTQGGEFIVVDYKATSKKDEVSLDGYWQQAYKRQVEVYQWILRGMGERVSNVAYFVYVNGNSDAASFDGKLEFSVTVLPHKGDTSWIEPTIIEIAQVLRGDAVPEPKETCEYCGYREAAGRELQARVGPKSKARKSSPTLGI